MEGARSEENLAEENVNAGADNTYSFIYVFM